MEPTPREIEVAKWVAHGLTNYQIGLHLGITHKTVEIHVTRLGEKLKTTSRTMLAVKMMKLEYFTLQEIEL